MTENVEEIQLPMEPSMTKMVFVELECTKTIRYKGGNQHTIKKFANTNQFTAGQIYIATVLKTGTHELDNDLGGLVRFTQEEVNQYFRRIDDAV